MQVSDYTIGSTTNTLALTLQNSIGSGSSVIGGDISIYAGDLTIKDGLTIAARPGFDVLVSSSGNFTNLAGSTAINTSNGGRWLVFAADAADNTYGSLRQWKPGDLGRRRLYFRCFLCQRKSIRVRRVNRANRGGFNGYLGGCQ